MIGGPTRGVTSTVTVQRPGFVPTRDLPVTMQWRDERPETRMAIREPALDAICAPEATARARIDSRTFKTCIVTGATVVDVVVVVLSVETGA